MPPRHCPYNAIAVLLAPMMLTASVGVSAADDCSLATVRCVGPGEEYSTSVPLIEQAFQSAVNAAETRRPNPYSWWYVQR